MFNTLAWRRFPGTVKQFQELSGKILNPDGSVKEEYKGMRGYMELLSKHMSGGNMENTFEATSPILGKKL